MPAYSGGTHQVIGGQTFYYGPGMRGAAETVHTNRLDSNDLRGVGQKAGPFRSRGTYYAPDKHDFAKPISTVTGIGPHNPGGHHKTDGMKPSSGSFCRDCQTSHLVVSFVWLHPVRYLAANGSAGRRYLL
jgi:hypothetical protein